MGVFSVIWGFMVCAALYFIPMPDAPTLVEGMAWMVVYIAAIKSIFF